MSRRYSFRGSGRLVMGALTDRDGPQSGPGKMSCQAEILGPLCGPLRSVRRPGKAAFTELSGLRPALHLQAGCNGLLHSPQHLGLEGKARAPQRAPEPLEVIDRHAGMPGLFMAVGMDTARARALVCHGCQRGGAHAPVAGHLGDR